MDNIYLIAASWMGLALVASLISIRLGISVALTEIGIGVIGGNFLGPPIARSRRAFAAAEGRE